MEVEREERTVNHTLPAQPKDAAVDGGVVVGLVTSRSSVPPIITSREKTSCVKIIFFSRVRVVGEQHGWS